MFIDGPSGQIEAQFDQPRRTRVACTSILCHPHPLYGGSMRDLVLDTVAQALLANGISCLRFNFRGVGASAGSHDNGNGEIDDLLAAIEWVRSEYPNDRLMLTGYSFGAHVTWQTTERVSPEQVLLIAPPVGAMGFSDIRTEAVIHAIAGDQDDFVDCNKLQALAGVDAHIIEGADHFFAGQMGELRDQLDALFK